jgi:hypothetical protein
VSSTGDFTYAPAAGFAGVDAFVVQVCDDAGACTTGTVTVQVFPVAVPDATAIDVNTAAVLDPAANDLGGPLQPATLAGQPSHGTASFAGGTATYLPDPGFAGVDTFPYEACTTIGNLRVQATVEVLVRPAVLPDTATTLANQPIVVEVEANDIGTLGPPTITAPPSHGTATAGASISYTPAHDYTGHDVLSYRRCSSVTPTVCGETTLSLSILSRLVDDVATTPAGVPVTVDVAANDVGQADVPRIVRPPTNGAVTVTSSGAVSYTPLPGFVGVDSFSYERCSPNAAELCGVASVTVTVTAIAPSPTPTPTPTPSPTPSPSPSPTPTPPSPAPSPSVLPTHGEGAAAGGGLSPTGVPATLEPSAYAGWLLLAAGVGLAASARLRRRKRRH